MGKLVDLYAVYFLTTYSIQKREARGEVGELSFINTPSYCSFLTTYTKEWLVGKRAHDRQWALP